MKRQRIKYNFTPLNEAGDAPFAMTNIQNMKQSTPRYPTGITGPLKLNAKSNGLKPLSSQSAKVPSLTRKDFDRTHNMVRNQPLYLGTPVAPKDTKLSNLDKAFIGADVATAAMAIKPVRKGIVKTVSNANKIASPLVKKAAKSIYNPKPMAIAARTMEHPLVSSPAAKKTMNVGKKAIGQIGRLSPVAKFVGKKVLLPLTAYDFADAAYRGAKHVYNHGVGNTIRDFENDPKGMAKTIAKAASLGEYPKGTTGIVGDLYTYYKSMPKSTQNALKSPAINPMSKFAIGAYTAGNDIRRNVFGDAKPTGPIQNTQHRAQALLNPHANANARKAYDQRKFKGMKTPPISEAYLTFESIMRLYEGDTEHQEVLDKTGFWGKQGAGAIIMAQDTGRILLPKRSQYVQEPDTWGVWGGAIEDGENPLEAAKREIQEESGYTGKLLNVIPLYVFTSKSFKYYNFLILIENEFDPRLDWETSEAKWVQLNDLPSPLHFGLKAVLNDPKSVAILKKFSYGKEQ